MHRNRTPRRGRRLAAVLLAGALATTGLTALAQSASAGNPAPAAEPAQGSPGSVVEIPMATADEVVEETIPITEDFDGGGTRYIPGDGLGGGDQDEDQLPVFEVSDGATLSNVIIGSPGADGIHCEGDCTLENVYWENVGEDAATFRNGSTYNVVGGGAVGADDKVLQFNGGGTLNIRNFEAEDFGTLVRSCGNCSSMSQRTIVLDGVTAVAPGNIIAGINENYGDTATFSNITVVGDSEMTVCQRYIGNDDGDEPEESGSGPDGTHCRYDESDISYQ
ncbi:pectate lyase [Streptomyces litchfieldiae]|uniref:Pectate lyase n=1 Tax=Streptomyces litchfieldiae TaxID=3075543 RepID=A0ABU2MW76_9ACTN|nr:pectate lyase [Streptomyces sp. DSM 44938]MDT0345098.1 pectate lyase [Streptomyces sp. DSM 44938]